MFTLVDMPARKADTPNVSLKEALATQIDRRGHSHREAGEAMGGISQQRVSSWLRGSYPDHDAYPAIAKYLHVSVGRVREMVAYQRRQGDPVERLTEQVGVLSRQVAALREWAISQGAPLAPG